MKRTGIAVIAGLTIALTGCGGTDESEPRDGGSADRAEGDAPESPADMVEIREHGFGQANGVAMEVVLVEALSDQAVGEFITISTNFMGADGSILATEEQVESFSWPGQVLVVPVRATIEDEVASTEITYDLSDYGMAEGEPPTPLDSVPSDTIAPAEFEGGIDATFTLSNPNAEPLSDLRVGIVCRNAAGEIIGGDSAYPELIAPNGQSRLDAGVTTSGEPASCEAFPNYDL